MSAAVAFVGRSASHHFSKPPEASITLLAGLGVEGDAHAGVTVKHRSRVAADPTQPNLRQVHLIHHELIDLLNTGEFGVAPGGMGENVTTRGVALLDLPVGARLRLGAEALIEITGLRNPCAQLDRYRPGLMQALLGRAPDGALIRKGGVMAIVVAGGTVAPGDPISISLPPGPHRPLGPV
jgi:MOSC domain-containing protein YiiM